MTDKTPGRLEKEPSESNLDQKVRDLLTNIGDERLARELTMPGGLISSSKKLNRAAGLGLITSLSNRGQVVLDYLSHRGEEWQNSDVPTIQIAKRYSKEHIDKLNDDTEGDYVFSESTVDRVQSFLRAFHEQVTLMCESEELQVEKSDVYELFTDSVRNIEAVRAMHIVNSDWRSAFVKLCHNQVVLDGLQSYANMMDDKELSEYVIRMMDEISDRVLELIKRYQIEPQQFKDGKWIDLLLYRFHPLQFLDGGVCSENWPAIPGEGLRGIDS